jgi:hypothetical protein
MGSAEIGSALGSGIGQGLGDALKAHMDQRLKDRFKAREGERRSRLMQDILQKVKDTPNFQQMSLPEQLMLIEQAASADRQIAQDLKSNLLQSRKLQSQEDKLQQKERLDLQGQERIAQFLKENIEGMSPTDIYKKAVASGLRESEAYKVASLARQSGREERLSEDAIRKVYNEEIKELRADYKDALPSKKASIKEQIMKLKKDRDSKVNRFRKGERSESLTQVGEEEASPLIEKEEIEVKEPQDEIALKLEQVFPPSQFNGVIKKHKASGKQYKSDGVRWLPI